MTDRNLPPIRRPSSLEMTAVIPRDRLAPPSTRNLAELDLDPNHPETQELYERARAAEASQRAERQERETMHPCPACSDCPCCKGMRIVTRADQDAWLTGHPVSENSPKQ